MEEKFQRARRDRPIVRVCVCPVSCVGHAYVVCKMRVRRVREGDWEARPLTAHHASSESANFVTSTIPFSVS